MSRTARGTSRRAALLSTAAQLRQPRYAALTALMIVVALVCVGAGTWQILRFEQKVHENDALTANARRAAVPVAQVLPLVGAPAPAADSVRYRTITATGRYDAAHQGLVRLRSVGDNQGFYVLTPLVTPAATLLVVRGFVAQRPDGSPPAAVAAPPSGTVTVRARLQTGESPHDTAGGVPAGQLRSINPVDQAARLGRPVYDGFAELAAGQPGTAGLTALPAPDLSNPAGGAVEPQHFAYIVQWYLFAALALAAPFAMVRADRRERERDDETVRPPAQAPASAPEPAQAPDAARTPSPAPPDTLTDTLTDEQRRAAKLADRYGRPVR